jgi:hypothetical protein
MPPVKGSATAGAGRRTHSPNPRLRFRLPAAGFVGPWPTGVCAGQPTSACHAGGTLGASWGTSARRATSYDRDDPGIRKSPPEGRCSA